MRSLSGDLACKKSYLIVGFFIRTAQEPDARIVELYAFAAAQKISHFFVACGRGFVRAFNLILLKLTALFRRG